MILVHENKDILTHNTARFLVLCNIAQKSFTVKASISLPKVVGASPASSSASSAAFRPATITSLSGKPTNAAVAQSSTTVQLGSMPGIYRLIRADPATPTQTHKPPEPTLNVVRESKQLKTSGGGDSSSSSLVAQQQQQQQQNLPRPVDVSSAILFVERGADSPQLLASEREPRAMQITATTTTTTTTKPQLVVEVATTTPINRRPIATGESEVEAAAAAAASAPIIMTNNHRIAGDDMQMMKLHDDTNFSIKYSANKVDEFALASHQQPPQSINNNQQMARSRSGRMRQIAAAGGTQSTSQAAAAAAAANNLESRMGDAVVAPSAGGELNRFVTGSANDTVAPTLAHNITGALLRWSLRTLGNLARKSLESLELDETATPPTSSTRPEDEQLDGFLVSNGRSSEPSPSPSPKPTRAPAAVRTTRAPPTTQRATPTIADQSRQARQQFSDSTTTTTVKPAQAAKQRSKLVVEREPEVVELETTRTGSGSLWPLYALWTLIGLVALIMAALYFVLAAPARRFSSSSSSPPSPPVAPNTYRKSLAGDLLAQLNQQFSSSSSKHRAQTSAGMPAADLGVASGTPSRRQATPPSPIGSATTRSTSAASSTSSSSSSDADRRPESLQNYCKTNEQFVVYTDYLLLDEDNELNAQATNRRPRGGESFA